MGAIILRGIKISSIVGTLLIFINYYELILMNQWSSIPLFKVILTYIVPFLVSTYSAISFKRSILNEKRNRKN